MVYNRISRQAGIAFRYASAYGSVLLSLCTVIRTFIILSLLLFGIALAAHYPAFIEAYYTKGLFIYLSGTLRFLFNRLLFSAGDILYALIIGWLLYGSWQLIQHLVKQNFRPATRLLLKGMIAVQILILSFYLLWGMNYYRQPGYRVLQLPDTAYTAADVRQITTLLIDSLNKSREQLTASDFKVSNAAIFNQSAGAVNRLKVNQLHLNAWPTAVKASLFTGLLNYMGTSGYNNPFTGEAQMNTQMPVFDRPVTACHEMAHQLGFAREDEANFVGFIAATQFGNPMLRYSGYYLATQEFLQYLHRRDSVTYKTLRQTLSAPVRADFKTDSLYWQQYEGRLERITGLFYGAYLKANNQPAGLHTYNRMIILSMAWYKKQRRKQSRQ